MRLICLVIICTNSIITGDGRCLLIIQSNKNPNHLKVKASIEELKSKTVELVIE